MFRSLLLTALLATSAATAAQAQTPGGPPIAYVRSAANSSEIYLVNPNGTGLSKLYTTPSKTVIDRLDLRPGGNEIAILERKSGSGPVLKIIGFNDWGVITTSRTVKTAPCWLSFLDYHPSGDGSLIGTDNCNTVYRVAPGAIAVDAAPLFTDQFLMEARWSASGDRIYYPFPGTTVGFIKAYDVATGTKSIVQDGYDHHFDVTRTGDRAIVSNGTNTVVDFANGTVTAGCWAGDYFRYGPGDTQMAYRQAVSGGYYVMIHRTDCAGSPLRLTGAKGMYSLLDWRADPTGQ